MLVVAKVCFLRMAAVGAFADTHNALAQILRHLRLLRLYLIDKAMALEQLPSGQRDKVLRFLVADLIDVSTAQYIIGRLERLPVPLRHQSIVFRNRLEALGERPGVIPLTQLIATFAHYEYLRIQHGRSRFLARGLADLLAAV